MSFFAGLVSGFAERTTERNDKRREEYLEKQKRYWNDVVQPRIKQYTEGYSAYKAKLESAIAIRDYLSSIGVPEDAQDTIVKASSNAEGKFDSSKAVDVWASMKKYYKPAEEKVKVQQQQISEIPQSTPASPQQQQQQQQKPAGRNIFKETFGYAGRQYGEQDQQADLVSALKASGIDPQEFEEFMANRGKPVNLYGSGASFDVPVKEVRESQNKLEALKSQYPNVDEDTLRDVSSGAIELRSSGGALYKYNKITGKTEALIPSTSGASAVRKTAQELQNEYNALDRSFVLASSIYGRLAENPEFGAGFVTNLLAKGTGIASIIGDTTGLSFVSKLANSFDQQEFGKYRSEAILLGESLKEQMSYVGKMGKDEREKLDEAVSLLRAGTDPKERQVGALIAITNAVQTKMIDNLYNRAALEGVKDTKEADFYVMANMTNYYMQRFGLNEDEAVALAERVVSENKNTIITAEQMQQYFKNAEEVKRQEEMNKPELYKQEFQF